MLFQCLCGIQPIFYSTHPNEEPVIFISIDDTEQDNLKKMCDEIFGASNFIADIIWKRKRGRDNSARWFSKAHEYCLVYAKNKGSSGVMVG